MALELCFLQDFDNHPLVWKLSRLKLGPVDLACLFVGDLKGPGPGFALGVDADRRTREVGRYLILHLVHVVPIPSSRARFNVDGLCCCVAVFFTHFLVMYFFIKRSNFSKWGENFFKALRIEKTIK